MSLASPTQILRNARTVAIGVVALAVLSNLPKTEAGLLGGILAGVGTAIAGGAIIVAGVVTANPAVVTAGAVVVGKAPLVGAYVGLSPTP